MHRCWTRCQCDSLHEDMSKFRIGVDIGGTKIEAAALDRDGAFVIRRRVATPQNDYAAALDSIVGLVQSVESEIGEHASAGFGIPGTISPATGVVKNAYNSPFNGHPLDRDIADRLGRPIRMMNDANCFALSEAVDGAAAGAKVVFGVILGTGCGGGIVIGGRPLRGLNAIAGEWGHNPLPWLGDSDRPARTCSCGKTGCIETYLSGTGFAATPQRSRRNDPGGARDRRPCSSGRPSGPPKSRPIPGSAGPGACKHHQCAGPGCHRSRRRHVERIRTLCVRAGALDGVGVLGPRRDPPRSAVLRRFERRARRGMALAR